MMVRMPAEDLEQFRERVINSPELQGALRDIDDWAEFTRVVGRESAALGLVVEPVDIERARAAARRAWLERWIP
jgi:hypothetical protein